MVKLNFQDKTLEKLFRDFSWGRNNTILLWENSTNHLEYKQKFKDDDYTLLHQFLCVLTTTDTYLRKMQNAKNKQFGILIQNGVIRKKSEITKEEVKKLLEEQIEQIENLLKLFDDKKFNHNIGHLANLLAHEYLHQGQLVVMFREAGITFPDRFQKAWAL